MSAVPTCVPVIFGPHVTPHCPAPSWWTAWHTGLVAAAACAVVVLAVAALRRYLCIDRMPRTDRRAWRSARDLADLCRLGAQWLEGDVSMQPAWRAGPDEEMLPLIPALAALNRAGFYTTASSPADDAESFDGLRWRQRAGVEGFADETLAFRLRESARAAGLAAVVLCPQGRPRKGWDSAFEVAITERDGAQYTWLGQHLSRREIRSRGATGWGICRRSAVRALCDSWQVAIVDPEWGRERLLWGVLAAAVRPAPEMIP